MAIHVNDHKVMTAAETSKLFYLVVVLAGTLDHGLAMDTRNILLWLHVRVGQQNMGGWSRELRF